MLKRMGVGVLWGLSGYVVGAVLGGLLISEFSSNTHDRSVEAATTALLITGPLAAMAAFVIGFIRSGRPG